jgi:ribosomal protein S18 acetylase RimI-like enzyme
MYNQPLPVRDQSPVLRHCDAGDAVVLAALGAGTFMESFGHLYPAQDAHDYVEKHYSLAQTQREMAEPFTHFWLLEAEGEAIGYAKLGLCKLPLPEGISTCAPDKAYELHRLYIKKTHQGGGHGPLLLRHTMQAVAHAGGQEMYIGVWSQNDRALALYGRHGFAVVANYWFEVGSQRDDERIMKYQGDISSFSA